MDRLLPRGGDASFIPVKRTGKRFGFKSASERVKGLAGEKGGGGKVNQKKKKNKRRLLWGPSKENRNFRGSVENDTENFMYKTGKI